MNSVVHTRGLDTVSFSIHITVLFLQLFVVQSHAIFQVHLSLSLYCSKFDHKIFRSRCFKPIPSPESIFNTFASQSTGLVHEGLFAFGFPWTSQLKQIRYF